MSLCLHMDMRWTNANMTSFRSPRTSAEVKLLTSPCPDGGQNYSFLGSNYQLLDTWLFLIWSPRASADDVKLCPTPCPIWLIASRGLLYTSEVEMISIHQSYCSSFCPTFSFRIEDMPILLQFSHHAVCCMACCEVQMTIHTGSVGGGYGLPLIPRKQNTWQ